MNGTLTSVLLVLGFLLVGAVFAAAEIALVSLREGQVRALSARGKRGERLARLAADPNRFLAAVQIGVTLAGFLSAAFGAATLADDLAPVLVGWGLDEGAAAAVALVAITLAVSYASLVLAELVPKRLALQRAEGVSLALAPGLDRIATLFRPVIWLLSHSTDLVVRLVGGDPDAAREQISEEELRELVIAHETLGEEERRIVEEVFAAGERQLREVMVPRTEVDFIDAATPVYKAVRLAAGQPHSRYPVIRGSSDEVVGFVHVRDLFDPHIAQRSVRVGDLVRDLAFLPGTKRLLPALSEMRAAGHHLAIVVDEYGGTAGIVTLEDLVEELVGDIRDEYDVAAEQPPYRRGGVDEVDGMLNLEDFADETGITLPDGPYETVAGFVTAALGHLPQVGETVDVDAHRLAVTRLEGRRVAQLRVTPLAAAAPAEGEDLEDVDTVEPASAAPDPVPTPAASPVASPIASADSADHAESGASAAPRSGARTGSTAVRTGSSAARD